MLPTNRVSTHPGVLLRRMYLDEMGISQTAFAKHCGMSLQRLNEIISGKRGVTAETAWLFAQSLGTSAEFWMNLQSAHELTKIRPARKVAKVKTAAQARRARPPDPRAAVSPS